MADQTTTERFIADTSDYVRRVEEAARRADAFGRSNSETALAARRMGLAASEAADRAGRAMREAANAAERLAREEISADEAARAAARGARELERADIAQAAAARAAARATNELADQQRRAAEAAVLAAGMQRLAALRASGNIRDHNLLLTHLRRSYTGVGDDVQNMASRAGRAFRMFQNAGTSASGMVSNGLAKVGEMGPLAIAGIAFGIAALPALAVAAGGIITLALGGALAGIGLMAAAKNAQVKASFSDMTSHVKAEVGKMSAPFVPVLIHIADLATKTFDTLAPSLKGAFAEMAPAVSHFADGFARGMGRLGPTITRVADEFSPLLSALGDQMPAILANVADGIDSMVAAAAGHEADIAGFVTDLSKIVSVAGDIVEGLGHVFDVAKNFASFPDDPWSFIKDAVPPLNVAVGLWKSVSGAVTGGKDALKGAATASGGTAAAFADMGKKTLTAADAAKELKTDLDALTGTALSARDAAAQYATSIFAMNKALHDNGAAHGFATQKGVANEQALTAMAVAAQRNATALTADGKSAREVATFMDQAREKIVATAQKMGYNSLEAQLLANRISGITKRLNDLPPGKKIKITADISAAMANIYTVGAAAAALGAGVPNHAKGGYIGPGYAAGGMVQRYATAGFVTGPGTGTSDDINAKLSNGEYVVRASATAQNRAALDAANYLGAQLVAVGKSSSWGKASQPPPTWGNASASPWGQANAGGAKTTTWMPPHRGLQSYGSQSGREQVVQNHFYISGSVVTENELVNLVQTKALQQGKTFSLPVGR